MLTFAIAQLCVLLGDLNAIATVITMFFMLTYGTINLACFYESTTGNPSYRPAFLFSHWSTALLGALGCAAVMVLIAPLWALLSILAMAGLHFYISRKEIEVRWGDIRSGAAFGRARRALLCLEEERYHPKNWRPIILALSGGCAGTHRLRRPGIGRGAGLRGRAELHHRGLRQRRAGVECRRGVARCLTSAKPKIRRAHSVIFPTPTVVLDTVGGGCHPHTPAVANEFQAQSPALRDDRLS